MIMVDCLQVFSEVRSMPGHGGSTQSLKVIHACGGLVSDRAAVKNHSFSDSGKYRCEATLDFHVLVRIYLTSRTSSWLRLGNTKIVKVIYYSIRKAVMQLTPSRFVQMQNE